MKTKVGFLLTSPQLQPLDGLFTACVHTLSVHFASWSRSAGSSVQSRRLSFPPARGDARAEFKDGEPPQTGLGENFRDGGVGI